MLRSHVSSCQEKTSAAPDTENFLLSLNKAEANGKEAFEDTMRKTDTEYSFMRTNLSSFPLIQTIGARVRQ
ncbi:hypothetical protein BgiBS90_004776 [Biomphalaria glabrata]|nr:hypothetical protein BgiBS90_004776 [Biomphalaria glabrata]